MRIRAGLIVGILLLIGACGSANNGSGSVEIAGATEPNGTAGGPGSSAAPGATSTTAASTTTTPPTTTPSTTTPPTTAAPTTTPSPAVAADIETLVAALPAPDELPAGWTTQGEPDLAPAAAMGPVSGMCGLRNAALRAQQLNPTAVVGGPDMVSTSGQWAKFSLYGFHNDSDAAEFIAQTLHDAGQCPGGTAEYEAPEGDGVNEIDLFDVPELQATWTVREVVTVGAGLALDADENQFITIDTASNTEFEGTAFGTHKRYLYHYERYGSVVIVFRLSGSCCDYGFSNVSVQSDNEPTFDELVAALSHMRPSVIESLTSVGVIAG